MSLFVALFLAVAVSACSQSDEQILVVEDGQVASTEEALINTGGGMSYTCTDSVGSTPTCTCTGGLDCVRMVNSGACGSSYVLECDLSGNTCSCDWVRKSASRLSTSTRTAY
jgi:hypothetical protein